MKTKKNDEIMLKSEKKQKKRSKEIKTERKANIYEKN